MRDALKKAGALTLGISGLGFLMVHAVFANGCRATSQAPEPQAPNGASEPARPPVDYENRAFMGATKAPPMNYFRSTGSSKAAPAVEPPAQAPSNAQAR